VRVVQLPHGGLDGIQTGGEIAKTLCVASRDTWRGRNGRQYASALVLHAVQFGVDFAYLVAEAILQGNALFKPGDVERNDVETGSRQRFRQRP